MADACLAAIGVETSADAVARHYGARSEGGLLDGWLVDDVDARSVKPLRAVGIEARAMPLLLHDDASRAAIAAATIELGSELR
jgi:LPPG:FO 2-phospho-L-lactate transferase